jgi:hypothetical protein
MSYDHEFLFIYGVSKIFLYLRKGEAYRGWKQRAKGQREA